LRTVRGLEVAAATVPVLLASGVVTGLVAGLGFALLAVGLSVAAGLVLDWFVGRRVAAWAYRERDDDLLVRRGVLIRRLSVVPYGRMQFVDVTAGPFERSFGLATVRMHTASAATDARIPGLESTDAARLRDQLARLGEAQAAGL
jgi:hypothetical protein